MRHLVGIFFNYSQHQYTIFACVLLAIVEPRRTFPSFCYFEILKAFHNINEAASLSLTPLTKNQPRETGVLLIFFRHVVTKRLCTDFQLRKFLFFLFLYICIMNRFWSINTQTINSGLPCLSLTLLWMGTFLPAAFLKMGHFTRKRRTTWKSDIPIPLPCGMLVSTRQGKGSLFWLKIRVPKSLILGLTKPVLTLYIRWAFLGCSIAGWGSTTWVKLKMFSPKTDQIEK